MWATHFKKKATMFGITPQNSNRAYYRTHKEAATPGGGTLPRKLQKLKDYEKNKNKS